MSSDAVSLTAAALPGSVSELRDAVVAFAREIGCQDDVIEAAKLAVSEAASNVVMHAYQGIEPGDILLDALEEDHRLLVKVCDHGVGLIPRTDSPGMGIGLALMAQVSDEFTISNRQGTPGTLVTLRFALAREPATAEQP